MGQQLRLGTVGVYWIPRGESTCSITEIIPPISPASLPSELCTSERLRVASGCDHWYTTLRTWASTSSVQWVIAPPSPFLGGLQKLTRSATNRPIGAEPH